MPHIFSLLICLLGEVPRTSHNFMRLTLVEWSLLLPSSLKPSMASQIYSLAGEWKMTVFSGELRQLTAVEIASRGETAILEGNDNNNSSFLAPLKYGMKSIFFSTNIKWFAQESDPGKKVAWWTFWAGIFPGFFLFSFVSFFFMSRYLKISSFSNSQD